MSKGIHINIDCDLICHAGHKATAEERLKELDRLLVDTYAGTQVSEILYCVFNTQRVIFPAERAECVWDGYDPQGGIGQPFLAGLRTDEDRKGAQFYLDGWLNLKRDGVDWFAREIARCREKGISPWLSARMNDIHNIDNPQSIEHCKLWREHPEFQRCPHKGFTRVAPDWIDHAFDYAHPEVRERMFLILEELAERYDFDGLELDWMRFDYHFRPGGEAEGIEILNKFTADVRSMLDGWEKKRGHRIRLSARVPAAPVTSVRMGMDAAAWARKGIIDRIVPTPHWATTDNDIPIEVWKEVLEGTKTELVIGAELGIHPSRDFMGHKFENMRFVSLEILRGTAMNYLARGNDAVYLYNYLPHHPELAESPVKGEIFRQVLNEIGTPETIRGLPRRHLVTFQDKFAIGEAVGSLLPARLAPQDYKYLRIPIGEPPLPGQSAWVVFWFEDKVPRSPDVWIGTAGGDNAFDGAEKPDGPGETLDSGPETRVNNVLCVRDSGFKLLDICKPVPDRPKYYPIPPEGEIAWKIPPEAFAPADPQGSGVQEAGRCCVVELHGFTGKLAWAEIAIA
jgi:hypothetical protein